MSSASIKHSKALKESQAAAHRLWLELEQSQTKLKALQQQNAELKRTVKRSNKLLEESIQLLEIATRAKHDLAHALHKELSEPQLAQALSDNRRLAKAFLHTASKLAAVLPNEDASAHLFR